MNLEAALWLLSELCFAESFAEPGQRFINYENDGSRTTIETREF